MPCGNPQDIAQILALLLPQNVTADEIIMSIVSELKSGSGGVFRGVYLSPLTSPFDSKANWPGKPDLCFAINECLGEHGRAVTDEHLQDECTAILGSITDEQFECLLKQGKL